MKRWITLAIILAATPGKAEDPETITVYGVANSPCSVWNRQKEFPNTRLLQMSFANGFLTALAMSDGTLGYSIKIPEGVGVEDALKRVDWYCAAIPEWPVAKAFAAMLGEFSASESGNVGEADDDG